MSSTPQISHSSPATKMVFLIPIAYLLHLAEEWFGGFSQWTLEVLGQGIDTERFILVNSVFFVFCLMGSLIAVRIPRLSWLAVIFASLFGLNGVLHMLATLGFGQYAPGVITGLVIYLPLSAYVLIEMKKLLSVRIFNVSIVAGIALHAAIFWLARI